MAPFSLPFRVSSSGSIRINVALVVDPNTASGALAGLEFLDGNTGLEALTGFTGLAPFLTIEMILVPCRVVFGLPDDAIVRNLLGFDEV